MDVKFFLHISICYHMLSLQTFVNKLLYIVNRLKNRRSDTQLHILVNCMYSLSVQLRLIMEE